MHELFDDGGFQAALIASAVLCCLAAVARLNVVMGWAAVTVLGAIVGLSYEHRLSPTIIWALVLLTAGGIATRRIPAVLQGVACVPGAVVLAQAVTDKATPWMRFSVVIAVAVAAPFVLTCARGRSRLTPPLLLATAVGVFVCVPETGPVHSVLGALLPAAAYGVVMLDVDPLLTFPLVGVVVWATVDGGATRPGSVIGGLACFGVLVLPLLLQRVRWWSALAVQIAFVLFVARVAGFEESASSALLLSLVAFGVAVLVMVVIGRLQRSAASSR